MLLKIQKYKLIDTVRNKGQILILVLTIIFSFCFYQSSAQSYSISNIDGDTIQTCTGTFYDSGSDIGSYGSNEKYTATFHAPAGERIIFSFTFLDLRNEGGDTLKIFDGTDTLAALIGVYSSEGLSFFVESSDSALTFQFTSDGSLENSGWEAIINCCPIPLTSPITGSASECVNNTGISYSVINTPGSTYNWIITGGTQASGTNTKALPWTGEAYQAQKVYKLLRTMVALPGIL